MRIRSIHPEFWRSEDVGRLNWVEAVVRACSGERTA